MKYRSCRITLLFALTLGLGFGPFVGNALSARFYEETPPYSGSPTVPPPQNLPNTASNLSTESPPATFTFQSSVPAGFGRIVGQVIDEGTGAVVSNARVRIPELRLAEKTDSRGRFEFDLISVDSAEDNRLYVTLVATAPGYGAHRMTNVGVFSRDTAAVTLAMRRGNAPTHHFGLIPKNKRGKPSTQPDTLPPSPDSDDDGFSTMSFTSETEPPPYIYLAIFELEADGSATGTVLRREPIDFEFYVRHVLPNEWLNWSSAPEALRAGAMAVKNYGWYHVLNPKYENSDCDNSTNCQVYNPYISYASTDQAVDHMSATGWYQDGSIFQSQYCAGSYDDTYSCGSNKMSQWGSKYWADEGKSHEWILDYYYGDGNGGGELSYFSYRPQPPGPKLTAVGASDSITLSFSSASSSQYAVWKWNGSSWVSIATTTNTSYTDNNVSSGQTYYYAAYGYTAGGWSKSSYNGGYIAANAKAPVTSPPTPKASVFFIATTTVGLRVESTASNIDSYKISRWNGSSWDVIYDDFPTDTATSGVPRWTELPTAYIDNTNGGNGDFVYIDRERTENTQYWYSAAIHDADLGWSDFINNGGSLTTFTATAN